MRTELRFCLAEFSVCKIPESNCRWLIKYPFPSKWKHFCSDGYPFQYRVQILIPANHDGVKNEGSMLTRASDRAAPADKSEGVED